MSRRRFSSTATLINDLLDRFEKGGGTTRPIASIDNDGFATVDQRDTFDEALEQLERRGGIDLVRNGRGSDRVVTGARLRDAWLLYEQVARQPAVQQVDEALVELRKRHIETHEVVQTLDAAASAWSRGVSFMGVAKNDVRTLGHVIGLAQAVHARSSDVTAAELDFRTFSRLSVGDSKALERNVRAVSSAISRLFGPDHLAPELEPEEFLGTVGIRRLPQPVLIRGPVTISGQPLPEMPFVGIPAESVDLVQLAREADYVISIENYTSFVRYVREVALSDNGLVIFSGGFPSRPTLNAIARLAEAAKAPTYHWGDMDAGGVRIFHHVERRLADVGVELRPHMMSPDLLRRVGVSTTDGLRMTGRMSNSAVAQLAEVIRETGLVHEQEELSPQRPLARQDA
jgi:hypothetical protein